MATLRELKGRIGSVASSEKITGAMKMISSAKMHKAEGELRRLVPFRGQIETIIANLLDSDARFSSPLTNPAAENNRIGIFVWGSDDGLCGAYNVNLYKQLIAQLGQLHQQYPAATVIIMPIGKKMRAAVSRLQLPYVTVTTTPEGIDSKTQGDKINAFTSATAADFCTGKYTMINVLYMRYISAGRQRPCTSTFLPVSASKLGNSTNSRSGKPCIFEPDPNTIFNTVLPMYLMSVMQDVFAENRASEQAARVMAMQSANDNAKTLLEQLQLEYNKLRQQSITSELLDIVGGQVRD